MNFLVRCFQTKFIALAVSLIFIGGFSVRAQIIPLPIIAKATFNITNYGAIGDKIQDASLRVMHIRHNKRHSNYGVERK